MFRKLCGDSTLKNVVLVTNMWDDVSPEEGEVRENELASRFFKPVLEMGAQMVRHRDTTQSTHDIIRRIMANHPAALQIQQELVDERRGLANTAAGEVLDQELSQLIRKHEAEVKELREEMAQALRERDDGMRRELEEERRKLQRRIEEMENVKKGMR